MNPKKILVVDDNKELQTLFEMMIGPSHDLYSAFDLRSAKRLVDENRELDVAFVDFHLKSASENHAGSEVGLDLFPYLKQKCPNVQAFLMSSYIEFAQQEDTMGLADGYISKGWAMYDHILNILSGTQEVRQSSDLFSALT